MFNIGLTFIAYKLMCYILFYSFFYQLKSFIMHNVKGEIYYSNLIVLVLNILLSY